MNKKKGRFATVIWAFQLAWRIDKRVLVIWYLLNGVIAFLPSISVKLYEKILDILSLYIHQGSGNISDVMPFILSFGAVLICTGISRQVNSDLIFMTMYDSYNIGVQERMISYAQSVDMEDFQDNETVNDYVSVILRAGALTGFVSSSCTLVGKFITIISLLFVAYQISISLFVVSAVYVAILMLVNRNFIENVREDDSAMRELTNRANYFESLPLNASAAKELRVFDVGTKVMQWWAEAYNKVMTYENQFNKQSSMRTALSGILFYAFVGCLLTTTLVKVAVGQTKPTDLLILFSLGTNLYQAISGFSETMLDALDGIFFLGRQKEFLSQEQDDRESFTETGMPAMAPKQATISVNNVSYKYYNGNWAIKDVSLDIRPGEIVAIVGENGSGKTTLVKLILGILTPQRGQISYKGKEYIRQEYKLLSKDIGVYFQECVLLHKTLQENIGYGNVDDINNKEKVISALKAGDAYEILEKLPYGLDTVIGKQVDKAGVLLSGGERQRVGVSRAYMCDKPCLVFDEPASALDPLAEYRQFLRLKEFAHNKTVLLISHRIGFARQADKIVVMSNGRIVGVGSHSELLSNNQVYQELYSSQASLYQLEKENEE